MKFLLFILVPAIGFAQTTNNTPAPSPTRFCPPFGALSLDPVKLTWSTQDGFKSYDMSFVTKITTFLGAQWNGANVGQITCIYSGEPKKTFPILLVYGTLALEPTEGKWSQNLGGIRNCKSRKQSDCPFTIRYQGKQPDLIQQLEQLKS